MKDGQITDIHPTLRRWLHSGAVGRRHSWSPSLRHSLRGWWAPQKEAMLYYFPWCTKIAGKSNLGRQEEREGGREVGGRNEGIILAHSSKVLSIMVGEAQHELETAGHIASAVKKHWEQWILTFSSFSYISILSKCQTCLQCILIMSVPHSLSPATLEPTNMSPSKIQCFLLLCLAHEMMPPTFRVGPSHLSLANLNNPFRHAHRCVFMVILVFLVWGFLVLILGLVFCLFCFGFGFGFWDRVSLE